MKRSSRPRAARAPLRRTAVTLLASAAIAASGAAGPAPARAAGGPLFVTNYLNSNAIAAVTSWQGSIALATSGGLVLYDPAAGAYRKILASASGLPSENVLCLAVAPSGTLWAGTADGGIARLRPDGSFRRTLRSFDGLPSDRVQTLCVLGDSIWVGTAGGVALFTETAETGQAALRRVDTNASTAGGLLSDHVNAFQQAADTLWAATDGGLSTLAGGTWAPSAALRGVAVRSLALAADTLWAATPSGPARYAAGAVTIVAGGHSGGSLRLLADASGLLSASSIAGVFRYAAGAWSGLGTPPSNFHARDLHRSPYGGLWAGTADGLARYDDASGVWSVSLSEGPLVDAFAAPSVRAAVDARGVWFTPGNSGGPSGERGAVDHFDGRAWSALWFGDTGGRMQSSSTFALLSDRSGRLWFGHCCIGSSPLPRLDRWDPATDTWDTPAATNIMSLAQAPSGLVYAGGVEFGNGIYVFDGSTAALVDSLTPANTQGGTGTGLTSNIIRALAFDSDGKAWIALRDRGLDVWDGRGTANRSDDLWTHVEQGLPSISTLSLAVAGPSSAWLGTAAGLALIQGGAVSRIWTAFTVPALPSPQVNDLALDSDGNLWIATDAGLVLLEADGSMTVYTTQDGLVDDDIASLAWDAPNRALWVGTAEGISRVVPADTRGPGFTSGTYLYPDPVTAPGGRLRLGGLTNAVQGEIRDPAGRIVRRFRADPAVNVIWDLTRTDGGPAAPGIYLVVLRGKGETRLLRVAVLR